MRLEQFVSYVRIMKIFLIIVVVCELFFVTELLIAQSSVNSLKIEGSLSPPVTSKQNQKLELKDKMFNLSLSLNETQIKCTEKITVRSKIKNLSESSVTSNDLKEVLFYLSKYPENEMENAREAEVYVGSFVLTKGDSKNTEIQIRQNGEYEFEVDLGRLNWNDWLHSFTKENRITELPKGKYYLFMKLLIKDEENKENPQFPYFPNFKSFTSNQIPVELKL